MHNEQLRAVGPLPGAAMPKARITVGGVGDDNGQRVAAGSNLGHVTVFCTRDSIRGARRRFEPVLGRKAAARQTPADGGR